MSTNEPSRLAHTTIHDLESVGVQDNSDHDDTTTVADPRSEVVSLTDQTNLLPRKKVMAVFFGLALCILVSCLDSTIVATALPTISAAFDAGSVVSWVPSAYFLTSTAFQPLCTYIWTPSCAAGLHISESA